MEKLLFVYLFTLLITPITYAKGNNPSDTQGLSTDEHGWEPNPIPSTADKALILSPLTEDFMMHCRAPICQYDDKKYGFKGIKLIGDFGVLEVLKHDDARPWITAVNEFNGEWVIVNPIRQTDSVMDCIRVGTMGHSGQDESTATDSICTIKGANGYTYQMSEELETWVVNRNIQSSEEKIRKLTKSHKTHLDTMGPDTDTNEGQRVYQQ